METESSVSDEMLMACVAAGQRDRLKPLVCRYAHSLLTFIQRMLGDRHLSEEVFQDVFFAVWNKRHQYESFRPFRPWLFAIAVNKCRENRRSWHMPAVSWDEELATAKTAPALPEDRAIATETAAMV